MAKRTSVLFLFFLMISVACTNWSNAEGAGEADAETKAKASRTPQEIKERVLLLEAEAQECKAMAEKIEADTKLQQALFRRRLEEQIRKSDLEIEMAKRASKKAQSEAEQANAEAAALDARLKQLKLATELKALEQTRELICDSRLTVARYEKIETEMKLAKLQREKESMQIK